MFSLFDRQRAKREKAAKYKAERLVQRYGSASAAKARCDQLINMNDDPRMLRFLAAMKAHLDN